LQRLHVNDLLERAGRARLVGFAAVNMMTVARGFAARSTLLAAQPPTFAIDFQNFSRGETRGLAGIQGWRNA